MYLVRFSEVHLLGLLVHFVLRKLFVLSGKR